MAQSDRIVLVAGATGKQGGAVARQLLEKGFTVHGMTRDPDKPAARELANLGIQVVPADLDDPASLERALDGVWGVFSVQTASQAGGVEAEIRQGKRLAEIAHDKGVQCFVYTSVGSADKDTGIPHFESKWQIEQTVRDLDFPYSTILRPVFFMENFLSPWVLQGDAIIVPLAPTTALQMIAVDDIGRFGAMTFQYPDEMNRREVDLAGDEATMPQAAAILSDAVGRQITFSRAPIEQVRSRMPEMAIMFEWFDRVGYSVDIDQLESEYDTHMIKLPQWARQVAAARMQR